ncbi:Lipase 3-like 3 [Homarus americanus]|uniref:Lipase 3-like 3 n=1 Tax=Homarus americanus TaxID=6706 RepID=A0A8J5T7G9_HOMAM|nr:Lipase 3-like 3 [Homarus americanus]
MESSADFVMNDPDQALGFMMADAGYDVWLGNNRGNYYGRQHVTLSPEKPEFWDYSWNEMAFYDVPAMLSYVRQASNVEQVFYVGHSMGCALLFAAMHYHPHVNSWIRVVAGMAPSSYTYHKRGPIGFLAPFIDRLDRELTKRGIVELLRLDPETSSTVSEVCGSKSITNFVFLYYFVEEDRIMLISDLLSYTTGTGLHVFTHLLQLHRSRRFQAFDYGEERNLEKYGTPLPPPLLNRVKVPVGLFYSDNDWVVDALDVLRTASELPSLALLHRVPLKDFNHLDFLWSENAHYLVYHPLIRFFNDFP